MASISLRNLAKTYPNGHCAASDLSLEIDDGELLVLVGPSGCGKVDGTAPGRRTRGSRRRKHLDRRRERHREAASAAGSGHGVPELRALSASKCRRESRLRTADGRDLPRADPRSVWRAWRGGSASRICWTAGPPSSREDSASAWRWAARSRESRRRFFSTSPFRTSMPSCGATPGRRSRDCTASSARRCST